MRGCNKILVRRKVEGFWQKLGTQNIFFFTLNIVEAAYDDDDLVVTNFALLASHKLFYCYMILIRFYAIKLTQNITTKIRFSILIQHQRKLFSVVYQIECDIYFMTYFKTLVFVFLWKTTLAERVHIFGNYIFIISTRLNRFITGRNGIVNKELLVISYQTLHTFFL